MLLYFSLLLLHILFCLLTYLGVKLHLLHVHPYMMFVVLCLPFWGVLIVLILHFFVLFDADDARAIQVEKMHLESELYKSVTVDARKNDDGVIPIEEALIINTPKERRTLIMDVLNDNPKEYVEFLKKAGDNEDTEVVHYAVTAMVEISKEVDYTLQDLERRYAAEPDNVEVLTEYCAFLWNCLEQNLLQGQVELMNRNFFNDLIEKKLAILPNITDYTYLVRNCFALKRFSKAKEAIEAIGVNWPDCEPYFLLKIEYFGLIERGDEIRKLLDEMDEKHIYLSSRAKEAIAFWNK